MIIKKLFLYSMNNIFLFQRALRLDDNIGLIQCLRDSKNVLPVFCLDPRQANPKKNDYFSYHAFGFMNQSLQYLNKELKNNLLLLEGEPHKVLPDIIKHYDIQNIYINTDYTPFAKKRTEELKKICNVKEYQDYLLFDTGKIITKSTGKAYRVYTPFLNQTKTRKIKKPIMLDSRLKNKFFKNIKHNKKGWDYLNKYSKYSPLYTPGNREEGLKRLKELSKTQEHYASCRNYLKYRTSNMSAYIKFGCVSIREAWYAFDKVKGKSGRGLKDQLIWREFYYQYYNDYPELLEWNKKTKDVKIEKNYPDIVKQCFNDLDKTGFLHNRGRMILANYLLHNKKKYWKDCDKMYAKRLVDYDPIVNIGNWLWIKKQPKFRWLKPEVQERKWNCNCPLIKKSN